GSNYEPSRPEQNSACPTNGVVATTSLKTNDMASQLVGSSAHLIHRDSHSAPLSNLIRPCISDTAIVCIHTAHSNEVMISLKHPGRTGQVVAEPSSSRVVPRPVPESHAQDPRG